MASATDVVAKNKKILLKRKKVLLKCIFLGEADHGNRAALSFYPGNKGFLAFDVSTVLVLVQNANSQSHRNRHVLRKQDCFAISTSSLVWPCVRACRSTLKN